MKQHPLLRLSSVFLAVSCLLLSSAHAQGDSQPVVLKWNFPGTAQKDLKVVQDAINAIIRTRIGATVDLQSIDWGSYEQKMDLTYASSQPCDLAFSANWINNYVQHAAQGNFLALDDLLPKFSPKLYSTYPKEMWNALKVKGNIYGVPSYRNITNQFGFVASKALADKYKLDLSKVNSYQDLTPFLDQIKKGEPGITPLYQTSDYGAMPFQTRQLGWDDVIEELVVVRYNDDNLKAFNIYDTEEFKSAVELNRKWYEAGYYPRDPKSVSDADADLKAGRIAVRLDQWFPQTKSEYGRRFGIEFVGKSFNIPFLPQGGTSGFVTTICRTSKNPEKALKFIELLHTDEQIFNLVAKGVQGRHWVWADQKKKVIRFPDGVTAATNGYNFGTDWMFGNYLDLAYYNSAEEVEERRRLKEISSAAPVSKLYGFNFDITPVRSEVAQLRAIVGEYRAVFGGRVDPSTKLPEMLSRLKQAGIEKVVAEAQRQIDRWKMQH